MANSTQNQRCKLVGVANESCFIAANILFAGNPVIWSDCLFEIAGQDSGEDQAYIKLSLSKQSTRIEL
jgi:hypothetical protein